MSFSNEVKKEILSNFPEDDCCARAFLTAVIQVTGSIIVMRSGITFSISTDNLALIDYVKQIINKIYTNKIEVEKISSKKIGKNERFEFIVPENLGNYILSDCGIVYLDKNNNRVINTMIDHHIIMEDCCKISYLKGAFVSSGLISIPNSTDAKIDRRIGGYHLEMQFSSNEQAQVVSHLMAEFGILPKKIEKKDSFLVYLKESEMISDFLALVGASNGVLKLQSEIINKNVRNQVNRESNCIAANIDKSINASLKQLRAIEIIDATIGLENLPENLISVARARIKNKEASLLDLVEILGENITKAGVNYKLKKIIEIAENIYGGQ